MMRSMLPPYEETGETIVILTGSDAFVVLPSSYQLAGFGELFLARGRRQKGRSGKEIQENGIDLRDKGEWSEVSK